MNCYSTPAEKFEDLMATTTERYTPKLAILRTQVGKWVVYSAARISVTNSGRQYPRKDLWRFHEANLINYTDLNRNQFFIYGDQ